MAYREQTYVERSAERCFCDARATRRCRCCRRNRCDAHVARGLCNRCGQAVDRERPAAASAAWATGPAVVVVASVALLAAGATGGVLVALAAGPVVGLAHYAARIARSVRRLRPRMMATVGELPPVPRDHQAFPEAPPARMF